MRFYNLPVYYDKKNRRTHWNIAHNPNRERRFPNVSQEAHESWPVQKSVSGIINDVVIEKIHIYTK